MSMLYKKGSLKSLKKTSLNLDEDQVFLKANEVYAISVLNYNIDGIGSAMVEKCIIETVTYQNKYGSVCTDYICKDSEYAIMSYSKLEELMLSSDWIVSEYFPTDARHPIEEIMRKGKHATKEN